MLCHPERSEAESKNLLPEWCLWVKDASSAYRLPQHDSLSERDMSLTISCSPLSLMCMGHIYRQGFLFLGDEMDQNTLESRLFALELLLDYLWTAHFAKEDSPHASFQAFRASLTKPRENPIQVDSPQELEYMALLEGAVESRLDAIKHKLTLLFPEG